MSRQLMFRFEELPLLIEGGFSAGLVNGQALINFWDDGLFGVAEIYLDGHKNKLQVEIDAERAAGVEHPRRWHEKPVSLDRGTHLFSAIHDRLENEWRGYVLDAIIARKGLVPLVPRDQRLTRIR